MGILKFFLWYMLLLNFCLRSILWMACVFTSKLQVKLSSQFYSWSSISREETFRRFYRSIPYLNRSLGRDREHGESHALKTIEFWQLKVICITSEGTRRKSRVKNNCSWVLVRPRESNPRPPALQSSALATELILPRLNKSRWNS